MMLLVLVLMVQLLTRSTAFTLHSYISTRLINGARPRKMIVDGVSDAWWTRHVNEEGLVASALNSRIMSAASLYSVRSSTGLDSITSTLDSARENADSSASNSSTIDPNTSCPYPTPTHTHFHDWQTKAGNLLDRLDVPSVAMVTQCDRSKSSEPEI